MMSKQPFVKTIFSMRGHYNKSAPKRSAARPF
jgi:hypothetical protein